MTGFNYPNHPLFRITPLLDKGVSTVLHDEYTSRLVGRIRAGRYTPDLWDCNSLYLGYAERLGSLAYRQVFAAKSRYQMTPEQLRAYRDDPALQEERARLAEEQRTRRATKKAKREAEETKLAAQRRAVAEERARFEQEYEERKAKRKADEEQRAREWERVGAETQQWLTERAWIMAGRWECTGCLRPSEISVEPAGRYAISCRICGRRAIGDHVTLLNVMNAHNARPEPEIAGSRL